jgi:hypothetical protein
VSECERAAAVAVQSNDAVLDAFSCPQEFELEVVFDGAKVVEKRCTVVLPNPSADASVDWGLVCGHVWAWDVGYW